MHAYRVDLEGYVVAARHAYVAVDTENLIELFAPSAVLTPVAL